MKREGMKELCKIILIEEGVTDKQVDTLISLTDELPYLESAVLKHWSNTRKLETVAKVLDVKKSYVNRKFNKAIRTLRSPRYYYAIKEADENYDVSKREHKGSMKISECDFSTLTMNSLKRNGFLFVEELIDYMSKGPEWITYIRGIGSIGLSQVLWYFSEDERKECK